MECLVQILKESEVRMRVWYLKREIEYIRGIWDCLREEILKVTEQLYYLC